MVLLWRCVNPGCTVYVFKHESPVCRCGVEAERIAWAIRPQRERDRTAR